MDYIVIVMLKFVIKMKCGKRNSFFLVLLLLIFHKEPIDINPSIPLKSFGPFQITRDGANRFCLVLDPTEYEIPRVLV